jgi:TolA-binding protein
MSNGKGDTPRPLSVDTETYSSNWERTFGNTPEKNRAKISASIQEIKQKIDELNEKVEEQRKLNELTQESQKSGLYDNCEYSGLPHTSSYED